MIALGAIGGIFVTCSHPILDRPLGTAVIDVRVLLAVSCTERAPAQRKQPNRIGGANRAREACEPAAASSLP
jgi:hypothetical protein